jgi:site-specific DNA-methyltransferase (adenine-specific)
LPQLAWAHAHETLLWASKDTSARHTFNYDLINSRDPTSQVSSVWRLPAVPMREKSQGRHPTQKPLRLVRRSVLASSAEGDLLFDPFCGSGTTGVAAKELGRFFVGAEKEREYAGLAARRIGAAERGVMLGDPAHPPRGRAALSVASPWRLDAMVRASPTSTAESCSTHRETLTGAIRD